MATYSGANWTLGMYPTGSLMCTRLAGAAAGFEPQAAKPNVITMIISTIVLDIASPIRLATTKLKAPPWLPIERTRLQPGNDAIQAQRHEDQDEHGNEDERGIVLPAAHVDQESQPAVRADQFADHRADHGQRGSNAQAPKEDRERGAALQLGQDLRLRGLQRMHEVIERRRHGAHADDGIDQ